MENRRLAYRTVINHRGLSFRAELWLGDGAAGGNEDHDDHPSPPPPPPPQPQVPSGNQGADDAPGDPPCPPQNSPDDGIEPAAPPPQNSPDDGIEPAAPPAGPRGRSRRLKRGRSSNEAEGSDEEMCHATESGKAGTDKSSPGIAGKKPRSV